MSSVQSIERAFVLLRALAIRPSGVTELAERVDLPKSTVARLLKALESEGAVAKTAARGEYTVGPAIDEIGDRTAGGRSLLDTARPFLTELSDLTGESSGLDMLRDGWVYFVDNVVDDHDVQVRDWTGESGRAHTVPGGLVMLAQADEQVIDDYIADGLEALTSNTTTDPDELRERLVRVRSAGYAWGFEEFAEGINSVAAPVFGPDGSVVAALRVHGPTFRFPDRDRTHDLGLLVADAAARLSRQLEA